MTMRADFTSQLTLTETLTGAYVAANDNTVTINGLNETERLDGSTSPAVTKGTAYQATLSGGAKTIDLTSLPGLTGDETVSLSGLKVQKLKLRNLSTNANNITIVPGASNGYNLFGASSSITLAPGQSVLLNGNNATPTVGSGARTLDITGTLAQVLEVEVAAG